MDGEKIRNAVHNANDGGWSYCVNGAEKVRHWLGGVRRPNHNLAQWLNDSTSEKIDCALQDGVQYDLRLCRNVEKGLCSKNFEFGNPASRGSPGPPAV
jgi:hypothetical protein